MKGTRHTVGGRSALAGVVVWALISCASTARAEPPKNACVATCEGAEFSDDARAKVAALVEPTLQTIRSCLAASGKGDGIRPIVLATVDGTGGVRTVRVSQIVAGGHEQLACMPKLTSVERSAAPSMLCDLGCDGSAPRPPIVVTPVPTSDTPPASTKPKTYTETWYGWQTLILDGAALALIVGGAAADSRSGASAAGFGILGYLLGPPIVHFAHRRVGAGFGSLGMRLLAPLGFAFVGALLGSPFGGRSGEWQSSDGAGVGAVIGLIFGCGAAVGIDAALLSYEKVETTDKRADLRKPHAIRVLPSLVLAPTPHGGLLGTGGLNGTF